MSKAHVAHATGKYEWYTPLKFIKAAKATMGHIDLDPASTAFANMWIQAKTYYDIEDDGLSQDWKGTVWMNPPYSHPLVGKFTDRLVEFYENGSVTEACVLLNNSTETRWFQHLLKSASAVNFIKGRVKFIDTSGKATAKPLQGQVVVYLGEYPGIFHACFGEFGHVLFAGTEGK